MITTPPRIVFLDAKTYGDVSLERFTKQWQCTVHQVTSAAEVVQRLKGFTVAVTNKVALDQATLSTREAADLRLIAVAATGTDIIDREAAARLGVKVCNVPGYATQSVAQFTLALILELATHVGRYGQAVRAGTWEKSPIFSLLDFPAIELSGKKLGIVGYGNIGRTVATMARALGMEVLIAARPGSNEPAPSGRLAVEELLRQSDIVTLHCPLTAQTKNLINEHSLSLMKSSAFLINTARGALIDESALVEALRRKTLAGAALDAISREPPTADHPIIRAAKELDNLLVTPHTAWSAREARERLLLEVAENIRCFFAGKPRNLVAP
jgi:glycerate dehydrogenase